MNTAAGNSQKSVTLRQTHAGGRKSPQLICWMGPLSRPSRPSENAFVPTHPAWTLVKMVPSYVGRKRGHLSMLFGTSHAR